MGGHISRSSTLLSSEFLTVALWLLHRGCVRDQSKLEKALPGGMWKSRSCDQESWKTGGSSSIPELFIARTIPMDVLPWLSSVIGVYWAAPYPWRGFSEGVRDNGCIVQWDPQCIITTDTNAIWLWDSKSQSSISSTLRLLGLLASTSFGIITVRCSADRICRDQLQPGVLRQLEGVGEAPALISSTLSAAPSSTK